MSRNPSDLTHLPDSQNGPMTSYTCPMHPDVRESGPDACPKCGMALEPELPVPPATPKWTCPMHPEIVRDGPGTCPICGVAGGGYEMSKAAGGE